MAAAVRLALTMLLVHGSIAAAQPYHTAIAVGHALPTKAKFGLLPTIRLERYLTSPNQWIGLVADAYVARAFPSISGIPLPGPDGVRGFRGTEAGVALSGVAQTSPRRRLSPYLVFGAVARLTSKRDSTSTPPAFGVSWGTEKVVEPNLGVGLRARLRSGRDLRLEVRYYNGLVFFPLTAGVTF